MAKKSDPAAPASESLGLGGFQQAPESEGISLDQLSQAFAQMLGSGDDPYAVPAEQADAATDPKVAELEAVLQEPTGTEDDCCEISPRTILEAMLFVGSADNRPLTSQQVSGLMRGVRPAEIDDLVRELNRSYASANCPYHIISEGAGYRMALRDEFAPVREKFYGRVRQAKLSPAAVEVLATVAYHEPLSADEVSRLRGTPSGAILSQLVRRQLLRIERDEAQPKSVRYYTTQRFLDLFGLSSLEDLPRSQELDKQ